MSTVSGVLANNASTLTEFQLSYNRIGDLSLEKLSEGLKRSRKLNALWLMQNELTSRSASIAILFDVLSSLPNLVELSVSGNRMP